MASSNIYVNCRTRKYDFDSRKVGKQIKTEVQKGNLSLIDVLLVAKAISDELAPEIFLSLVRETSYERLEYAELHPPINKGDFYAYRRQAMAILLDILQQ